MILGMTIFIAGLAGIELSGCTPSSTPSLQSRSRWQGQVALHQGSFILSKAAEGHTSKSGSQAVKAFTSVNTLRYCLLVTLVSAYVTHRLTKGISGPLHTVIYVLYNAWDEPHRPQRGINTLRQDLNIKH